MNKDKYVITNCKSLISNDICELYSQKGIHLSSYCYCTDINCLLKQIAELCEEESSIIQHKQKVKVKGLNKLADKIFELLDIQEVE